ncbi:MAG: hypothetical protein D6819_04835 [Gammaproteobacteria bacterium]|nr:MAG: hypothetical protein D6819_04835 [Gammaproteobacteria bacterium]
MYKLPEVIDPWRYARQGRILEGVLSLAGMARLRPQVEEGSVEVHLAFGIDERHIPYMQGHFTARLRLPCQRCLEPMALDISQDISLGIVASEAEIPRLGGSYEPLVAGGNLRLAEVLEDELMLALPLIPKHPLEVCPARDYIGRRDQGSSSPFSVLSAYTKE